LVIFQEIEDSPDVHPFSERLNELIEQARDIKEALIHYLADTAQGARRVSLSTVHFLKDSLGKSLFFPLKTSADGIAKIREPAFAVVTTLERRLIVANRQALAVISTILSQVFISSLRKQFENVDQTLQPTLLKLQAIRIELQDLRAERDLERLAKTPRLGMPAILECLGGLRDKLQVIESKKVDGSFRSADDSQTIPRGQAVLDTIMNECLCLVVEIQA
jgi:hypothetical protein